MSRRQGAPPRWARALLDLCLLRDDAGSITGDLDEEYARFVRPTKGRWRADAWYWRQTLMTIPRLLARRLPRSEGGGALAADTILALKLLRRRPRYVVATVGTLALALGANTTVFSAVHSILLQPLPYDAPERLVRPMPDQLFFLNSFEAQRLGETAVTLESMAAWARTLLLFDDGTNAEEVRGAVVAWNHFDVLGSEAALGRTFVRDDAEGQDAVVLSHGLWVRRFAGDRDVVGQTVDLNGRQITVVGVMPANHVPLEFDWQAWRPLPLDPAASAGMGMAATGRLRPGVTMAQAEADIRRALGDVWSESGDPMTAEDRAGIRIVPIGEWLFGDVRASMRALMAAVGLVLLLACANVANLVIAEGGRRRRELAVRSALGGSRFRLMRQLFLEVLILTATGGAAGLLASGIGHEWFVAQLPPDIPRVGQIRLGGATFLFASGATLLAALLTGVLPALRAVAASTGSLAAGSGRHVGTGRGQLRLRAGLVSAQTATALTLLVCTGIMARSLVSLRTADPGFDPEGVITVRPSPASARYPDGPELDGYYDQLALELERLPNVTSVGAIQFLPMTPGGWWDIYAPETAANPTAASSVTMRVLREGYFQTMRIPITSGRDFTSNEWAAEGPLVAVVNERLAREAYPNTEAVGRNLLMGEDLAPVEIIGVAGDVRQSDLRTETTPELYMPFDRNPWRRMHLVVRADGDPAAALIAVRDAVRGVDSGVPLLGPRPLVEVVQSTYATTNLIASLMAFFGLAGLALGAIGIYGVTSMAASERRRDIGIRIALGARVESVLTKMVLRGLAPVGIGLVVGLLAALVVSSLLEGLVFGVGVRDPWTLATAPVVLMIVALAAVVLPTYRAGRVDPVETLREE